MHRRMIAVPVVESHAFVSDMHRRTTVHSITILSFDWIFYTVTIESAHQTDQVRTETS